jgi:hypothetical protein
MFLLPVRIEARFRVGGDRNELRVRIFPDEIAITAHRRELTKAAPPMPGLLDPRVRPRRTAPALRRLSIAGLLLLAMTSRYQETSPVLRGAWALETLLGTPVPPPPPDELQFPEVETVPPDFSVPPRSYVLPDRFVVMAFVGDTKVHEAIGAPIAASIAFGPDPQLLAGVIDRDPATGKIFTDPALAWLVDYDKAVEAGLAVTIPIDAQSARTGFDRVVALGVKYSASTEETTALVGRLLEDHHFTDGIGVAPQGTPTNNTSDIASGFSSSLSSDIVPSPRSMPRSSPTSRII